MAISRWKPSGEIENFRTQFDRLFDNFHRSLSERPDRLTASYPVVDIKETKDEYVLTAEVPGLAKDEISIRFADNTLTIKGEKKEEKQQEGDCYHCSERQYGSFQRSFSFDAPIENNKITATSKDGILQIILPKKEESKPKEISISVS